MLKFVFLAVIQILPVLCCDSKEVLKKASCFLRELGCDIHPKELREELCFYKKSDLYSQTRLFVEAVADGQGDLRNDLKEAYIQAGWFHRHIWIMDVLGEQHMATEKAKSLNLEECGNSTLFYQKMNRFSRLKSQLPGVISFDVPRWDREVIQREKARCISQQPNLLPPVC